MKLTKTQQFVLDVINANDGVQNDEAYLIAAVWRTQGWSDHRSLEDNIRFAMHPESISRRRRDLFNFGLIKYSDKAMQTRTEAFKNELEAHSDYEHSMNERFNSPLEQIGKLTIKPEDHQAVSWLND